VNQRDLANIRFLLACTPDQLKDWYNSVSDDDLVYASLIMEHYAILLETEVEFAKIDQQIEDMPVMTEAQAVIAMVRG